MLRNIGRNQSHSFDGLVYLEWLKNKVFYNCYASYIRSYDDMGDFYQICSDSIDGYNENLKRVA